LYFLIFREIDFFYVNFFYIVKITWFDVHVTHCFVLLLKITSDCKTIVSYLYVTHCFVLLLKITSDCKTIVSYLLLEKEIRNEFD